MFVRPLLGLMLALVGCARPTEPAPAAAATPPRASESRPSPPPITVTVDAGPPTKASSTPRCLELAWSRARCATPFDVRHPIDALAWLGKRGIKVEEDGLAIPSKVFEHVDHTGGCETIAVGPAKEDALACAFGYGTMDGVSIGGFRIITVRKERIVLLLEVLDGIGEMPVAPPAPDAVDPFPLLFGLDVNIEKPEQEIVVAEPTAHSCAEARATLNAPTSGKRSKEQQDGLAALHRWLKKTCDGAKRYVWSKDKFAPAP